MTRLASLWKFIRTERQWVILGVAYLMAWWLPISLLWPLLRPGSLKPEGIDGPVSWLWKNHWGVTQSPLSFQGVIPIGVALLLYRDRAEAAATLARPDKKTPYLLIGGCLALAASHLIHLPSLAIAALILIAAGIVAQVYGLKMLKALRVPFLFWLFMIPPPESLAGVMLKIMGALSMQLAGISLKVMGKNVIVQPPQLVLNNVTMEVASIGTETSSGAAAVSCVAILLLFWGLYRRWRIGRTLMAIAIGVFCAVVGNMIRIDAALLLRASSVSLSDLVLQANSWLLAVPAAALTLWLDNRAGKLAAKSTGWLGKLLASGWEVSGKGADKVMDTSAGVVKGAATGVGKVVTVAISPIVFVLNVIVNGIGKIFGLYGESTKVMEKRWREAERARRNNKAKKRGQM